MTNFGQTVRKRLIDLDKTQDWLAAQVRGMGIPCNKTYLSKILNGARKGKQVKAAIEKILDLDGGALGGGAQEKNDRRTGTAVAAAGPERRIACRKGRNVQRNHGPD